jgi:hypothetical protein
MPAMRNDRFLQQNARQASAHIDLRPAEIDFVSMNIDLGSEHIDPGSAGIDLA